MLHLKTAAKGDAGQRLTRHAVSVRIHGSEKVVRMRMP
jgi:hypothetical protein